MIRFTDGPAEDYCLKLQSAPLLLRVVRSADGTLAALNLPQDLPEPDDEVFAYVRKGSAFVGHVDVSERGKRRSVPFLNATYQLLKYSPDESLMRQNDLWQSFCDGYLEGVVL